jgi:hypothetical protein
LDGKTSEMEGTRSRRAGCPAPGAREVLLTENDSEHRVAGIAAYFKPADV